MKKIILMSVAITLFSSLQIPLAQADNPEKTKYVASVVSLLRLHAQMIRQISANDFKYSENLARHAKSLQRAFGLVGPMDWHAAKSETLYRHANDSAPLESQTFEKLAENSNDHMKNLYSAAHKETKTGERGLVVEALDELQHGCEQCHNMLPPGMAPNVWDNSVPPGK
ncbi:MAG: cytochrome c [Magnetococcales bacterium]|nr:cytochrome c [Magnetococcales bacterium]